MAKIRDSCQSCAVSKVRCPKERPVCSRCEIRGIACAYHVTKRPGRRREKPRDALNSTGATNHGSAESSSLMDIQTDSICVQAETVPAAGMSPPSPPASSDFSSDFASFLDDFAAPSAPLELLEMPKHSAINSHFTDLLMLPLEIEADSLHVGGISSMPKGHRDIADVLTSDEMDANSDSFRPLFSYTMPSALDTPVHSLQMQPSCRDDGDTCSESGETCRCLALATDLLRKLFSPTSPSPESGVSGNSVPVSSDKARGTSPPTMTLLEQNKETIEAVSNILQCPCAETGYLTTMLSMILFKVLELYAMAVRQVHCDTPGGAKSSPMPARPMRQFCVDSSCPDDRGTKRTSTQQILGELHHVQSTLNKLALRLSARDAQATLEHSPDLGCGSHTPSPLLTDGCIRTETFSAATLGRIEADLQRGLSTLSSEIITKLRRS